jgi:hypothetical protein
LLIPIVSCWWAHRIRHGSFIDSGVLKPSTYTNGFANPLQSGGLDLKNAPVTVTQTNEHAEKSMIFDCDQDFSASIKAGSEKLETDCKLHAFPTHIVHIYIVRVTVHIYLTWYN